MSKMDLQQLLSSESEFTDHLDTQEINLNKKLNSINQNLNKLIDNLKNYNTERSLINIEELKKFRDKIQKNYSEVKIRADLLFEYENIQYDINYIFIGTNQDQLLPEKSKALMNLLKKSNEALRKIEEVGDLSILSFEENTKFRNDFKTKLNDYNIQFSATAKWYTDIKNNIINDHKITNDIAFDYLIKQEAKATLNNLTRKIHISDENIQSLCNLLSDFIGINANTESINLLHENRTFNEMVINFIPLETIQ